MLCYKYENLRWRSCGDSFAALAARGILLSPHNAPFYLCSPSCDATTCYFSIANRKRFLRPYPAHTIIKNSAAQHQAPLVGCPWKWTRTGAQGPSSSRKLNRRLSVASVARLQLDDTISHDATVGHCTLENSITCLTKIQFNFGQWICRWRQSQSHLFCFHLRIF